MKHTHCEGVLFVALLAALAACADPASRTAGLSVSNSVKSEPTPSSSNEERAALTNFRGSLVGGIGAATTLVGVLVAANSSNNASSPVLVIGGLGAMVWFWAQHLSMSYSALSRALWWYNRDLTR